MVHSHRIFSQLFSNYLGSRTGCVPIICDFSMNTYMDKKVLQRECKRHTAHHIASARYTMLLCLLTGGGGYPIQSWTMGVPHPVHPDLDGGYPLSRPGIGVPPCPDLIWGNPLSRPGMGYPCLDLSKGYPPS